MKDVEKILDSVCYCTLATTCEDGSPWSTPVFFVYDEDKNIYWWSSLKALHSKNIQRTQQVFITVFSTNASESSGRGVYVQARASALEAPQEIEKVSNIYNSRTSFVKLTPDITTGIAPTRIFKAEPKSIWLNAEGKEGEYYVDVREQVG